MSSPKKAPKEKIRASKSEGKAAQEKPKRVRTGCLTCRDRHLKCDEGHPDCENCLKSNRICKRGVRLNYLETSCRGSHFIIPPSTEYQVAFQDESREIAGEYVGGRRRYAKLEPDSTPPGGNDFFMNAQNGTQPPIMGPHQTLPSLHGMLQDQYTQQQSYNYEHQQGHSRHESAYSISDMANTSSYTMEQSLSPTPVARDYLNTQEEVLFMQVFVEEVGLWMDSMDPNKHFSRLLPFHALSQPMLLNAFLACGARHLALVNPKYSEDKALGYYDTATRFLLDSLQDPSRDTVLCATTAVILNVYEIMCEKALQRMNHIAGARALIKECGWNATSTGVGAACFWLNVGMELLSCLHFNWQVAWDPDEWGVSMEMSRETESGREELWTHKIVYVVAKVCNFRASIPRTSELARANLDNRHSEWLRLKNLADSWNHNIPRTMHPMAFLAPGSTISGSAFPEVWLIKRASIVARLFYHTCQCLLAQINPIQGPDDPEMAQQLREHSQLICGISAHVKDRGVASVALRSLAIAAECLTERREQEEVLQIFDKIRQETGWRVGFLNNELKQKWGWAEQSQAQEHLASGHVQNGNMTYQQQGQQPQASLQPTIPTTSLPTAAPTQARRRPSPGVMNPLLATADFSMPQHPYQSYYVAPNPIPQPSSHQPSYNGSYL